MNVFDLFPGDNKLADNIAKAVKEDSWHAGDNAWSSEHDQWAKESVETIPALTGVSENSEELQLGDEVLVTYPNQFQGKRGEITGFGRNKAFVIVEINGKEYSMHSSDVERLGGSEDWDNDDDYGTFGDDERDELDEYKGAHDKITFEVDSENAYNHIMQKYGNVIDWAGDYMTVPARYWPAVQELAFAAGGDVQEIELNEDGGEYYYETLAKKVFAQYPDLSTKGRADELLDAGWKIAAQDLGVKRARWEFNYDEDFPSDFVSAYAELQRGGDLEEGWKQNLAALGTAAALGAGGMAAFGGNSSTAPTSTGPELVNPQQVVQMIKAGKITNQQDLLSVIGKAKNKSTVWKVLQSQAGMEGSSDADAVVQTIAGNSVVREGASLQDVFNAITHRIERQMPELFTDYGVEVVANAIKDVAEFHEGAEELGSSDVGGMVREVVRNLKQSELRKALDEVKKMSTQAKFEKHLAKHGYDVNAKQKYWDQKIKDIDAQIAAWDKEMAARKSGVAEGEYDDPRWEPREPDMSRKVDWDIEAERNKPDEQESAKTVTITDYDGNVVLTFPSTGGFYGDKRYAVSKGFDTERDEYHMSWKRDTNESGQGDDSTSPVGGNVQESKYLKKLKQERFLKEHKKAFSMLDELNEVFKDK